MSAQQIQTEAILKPLKGSQTIFLQLDHIYEVLYHGSRGFGKSTAIFMDFLRDVGKGYGSKYRGMIVRDEYNGLTDLKTEFIEIADKLYPADKDGKKTYSWNYKDGIFSFPTGEILYFAHCKTVQDADSKIKGKNLTRIYFDELTNWPDSSVYDFAKTSLRTTIIGLKTKVRATTNPYGIGKQWVKRYYIKTCGETGKRVINGLSRATLKGHHSENPYLNEEYIKSLKNIEDESTRNAFYYGSWEGAGNTVFAGCFVKKHNVLPQLCDAVLTDNQFEGLYLYRSFDWGFSAPFSLGWCIMTDNRVLKFEDGRERAFVYGDIIRVHEFYGSDKNKINTGIKLTPREISFLGLDIEEKLKTKFKIPILKSGADMGIFAAQSSGLSTASIADQMKPLDFVRLKTSQQISRANGLATMQTLFKNAHPKSYKDKPLREDTALFITENCTDCIDQIQNLPRDDKKPDDVNTLVEDHIYDEFRYSVMHLARPKSAVSFVDI